MSKLKEAYCKDYYEYYIPISKKTFKTTKKFRRLLSMCKKYTYLKKFEIDPTADGQIEFNWINKKYVLSARIFENEILLGKLNKKNSKDKMLFSLLYKNFTKLELIRFINYFFEKIE